MPPTMPLRAIAGQRLCSPRRATPSQCVFIVHHFRHDFGKHNMPFVFRIE